MNRNTFLASARESHISYSTIPVLLSGSFVCLASSSPSCLHEHKLKITRHTQACYLGAAQVVELSASSAQ